MTDKTGPVLFFIAGEVPTSEEFNAAKPFFNNGPILQFVSLSKLDVNAPLRPAAGVAGLVPELYSKYTVLDKPKKLTKTAEKNDNELP